MVKKNSFLRLASWILVAVLVFTMAAGAPVSAYAADNDIVVLYTNDVHCGVDDNIGYAGLALYKKEMQAMTPYVVLVDAGDAVQGAPIGSLSNGSYIIEVMNQLEYDFAVPGNHEFDYGMERFMEMSTELNCGYYSCNFMDLRTGKSVFAPYKMFDLGGTKVAFVGATTPETYVKSTPVYFQDGNGNYIYGLCENGNGQELYQQVQSAVNDARKEGAQYVILVGHLGEEGTTEVWTSDAVIANTTGIDACIDGHSHEVYEKYVNNKDGEEVLLTQSGTKLSQIGRITISANGTITSELITEIPASDSTGRTYTVMKGDTLSRIAKRELGSYQRWQEIYNANRNVIRDPNLLSIGMRLTIPGQSSVNENGKAVDYVTDQFIKGIQSQYEETLKTVIGHTDATLTINDAETGLRAVRSAETNLGDLTADAYRVVLNADIGFTNGGGIRADIPAGDITYNDALTVFPFGNMGCVIEATGQQIKDALEFASMNCPEEGGCFLQVSGMTYTVDTTIPASVQVDEKGNFTGVNGAYRVKEIMVGGEALDLSRTYTVANNKYLLKLGGGGMTMFDDSPVILDSELSDMDVLSVYIRDSLGGNVGSEYADPSGQGRITVIR